MTQLTEEYFNTISAEMSAEFRDRGSRFIGYTFPVADVAACKDKLAAIKKEHAKATHHCFAYRLGLTGDIFRVSDDGEPSGTAGRPILGQIDSRELTNVMVVVVRYFGGSLLGVPGLIQAYKSAAALALQVTPLVKRPILVTYRIQFDYTQMNDIMRIVKQFDCQVHRQETQLFALMEIGIPKNRLDEVIFKLRDLRNVEVVSL